VQGVQKIQILGIVSEPCSLFIHTKPNQKQPKAPKKLKIKNYIKLCKPKQTKLKKTHKTADPKDRKSPDPIPDTTKQYQPVTWRHS
jgi:hypothetical protein